MAKPAAGAIPLEKLELYEKLVATNPNVERKGDTVPYTSLNGHMFSYPSKRGRAGFTASEWRAGSVSQEIQGQVVRGLWKGSARVRRGSRLVALLDARIEEVLRQQL